MSINNKHINKEKKNNRNYEKRNWNKEKKSRKTGVKTQNSQEHREDGMSYK